MEQIKVLLKDLLVRSDSHNNVFKRNLLKEYLQIFVLDFIYSHPEYSKLVFYGGSCLTHCFGLARLSEDLDFVDLANKISLKELASDLKDYFAKNTDLSVTATVQKFRIYLKFPILQNLGLSREGETDLLFLKVEVFNKFNFCKTHKTEIVPLFKFNKSILIKTFDLSTLMATKIRAILNRKWEKTDKQGNVLIKVKGRDYFDLMWYLEKGIRPNIGCIEGIKNKNELKEKLLKILENIDTKSIQLDLEALVSDENFTKKLSKEIKQILIRKINSLR